MIRLSRHSLTFLLTGTLALPFAVACGGDDDANEGDPDAGDDPDAAGDPDSGPDPVLARSATIAITETTIVGAAQGHLNVIAFANELDRTVAPVAGFESNLNGCAVFVYDVEGGEEEPEFVDEGTITVEGTAVGDFECTSRATGDAQLAYAAGQYTCKSTDAVLGGGVAGNAEGAILTPAADTLTLPIGVAADASWVGRWIELHGFSPLPDGTKFPIMAVTDGGKTADTLQLLGVPDALGGAIGPVGDTAMYTNLVGYKPKPAGGVIYIEGEDTEVTITKEAGDVIPALDESIAPAGEGFVLVTDEEMGYVRPNAIPTDAAQDVTFHCEECGDDGSAPGGGFTALIINGRTTDVLPEANDTGLDMLPAETAFATFQCSFLTDNTTGTIPEAAMEAILGTNPARLQVSVGRVAGYPRSSETFDWRANIIVGHTELGFTTIAK